MNQNLRIRRYRRRYAYTGAVFLLLLYYMLWPVNFYLAENLISALWNARDDLAA